MFARIVISALLATGVAAPVQAQNQPSQATAYVTVDKAARASHALLKHRLAVAVEEVCGSYAAIEPYQVPELDACRRQAWASANRQLAAMSSSGDGRIVLATR